jgi:hypothetical protein
MGSNRFEAAMNADENPGKGVDRSSDEASPKRTYALVVGIEHYEAGPNWDLAGPATDALGFTSWLRERGVPADQILLFLSPLDKELPGASLPAGVATGLADCEPVKEAITRTLPGWRADLLWLFWAGHVLQLPFHGECLTAASSVTARSAALGYGE